MAAFYMRKYSDMIFEKDSEDKIKLSKRFQK